MDGFRERLSGRYDRGNDRTASRNDRYSSDDRYDRAPRRDSVGIEAINSAIDNSNRDQLEIIADMFDEAKADRLESEKAIIRELSKNIERSVSNIPAAAPAEAPISREPEVKEPIVVTSTDNEALSRIERMAGQNAESLSEGSEMLERSISSLRNNTELLNEIKGSVSTVVMSQEELKSSEEMIREEIRQALSENRANVNPAFDPYAASGNSNKEEILSAIGDNRSMLSMIRQDILTGFSKTEANADAANADEDVIPLSGKEGKDYYEKLEDQIHKECVKCFRNVENTLKEQNAQEGVEKSIAGVHTIGVISIALNVVTIVLIVCRVFGII